MTARTHTLSSDCAITKILPWWANNVVMHIITDERTQTIKYQMMWWGAMIATLSHIYSHAYLTIAHHRAAESCAAQWCAARSSAIRLSCLVGHPCTNFFRTHPLIHSTAKSSAQCAFTKYSVGICAHIHLKTPSYGHRNHDDCLRFIIRCLLSEYKPCVDIVRPLKEYKQSET